MKDERVGKIQSRRRIASTSKQDMAAISGGAGSLCVITGESGAPLPSGEALVLREARRRSGHMKKKK